MFVKGIDARRGPGRPRKTYPQHAPVVAEPTGPMIEPLTYTNVDGKKVNVPPHVILATGMALQGRTDGEIGARLNVNRATVSRWFKQYADYVDQQLKVRLVVEDMIKPLVPKAVRTYSEILDDPDMDPNTKQRTASDVLDRYGGKPVQKNVSDERKEVRIIYEIIEGPVTKRINGAEDNVIEGEIIGGN